MQASGGGKQQELDQGTSPGGSPNCTGRLGDNNIREEGVLLDWPAHSLGECKTAPGIGVPGCFSRWLADRCAMHYSSCSKVAEWWVFHSLML